MDASLNKPESDYSRKLIWLMVFRVVFAALLLGSTTYFQLKESQSLIDRPLLFLYGLIVGILILSACYSLLFKSFKQKVPFAYIQLSIDTVIVTLIIFVTGSFSSVFHFLYLIVIICGSMLLFRSGIMVLAGLCSLQYGVLVIFEYYNIFNPFSTESRLYIANYALTYVLYKVVTTIGACFLVAFLSSILAEQERKSRKKLLAMEENVKRVEKMAAMGEMAAGLAHEIKNPLASLSGAIQLLSDDAIYDSDQSKLMQIVLRETNRLSKLLSEFLLFAKPQRGKLEAIQLDKALSEMVDLVERHCFSRERISFVTNFVEGIYVEMDSGHLSQIIWNLLLNAVEAIEGSGTVSIETYAPNNKYVCIKITDNGCGISEDTVRSIFDPFFTTKKKGTGLGLSIVHRILESYNGQLDVISEVEMGSAFTLKLNQALNPVKGKKARATASLRQQET